MGRTKKRVNPRRGRVAGATPGGKPELVPGGAAPPVAFDAARVAEQMRLYWRSGSGSAFVVGSESGRWAIWPEQAVIDEMRCLPDRIIAIKAREDERVSEVKRVFLHVRKERVLDEVFNALPGYRAGIHELPQGERVLVKSSPRLVEPVEGDFPTIKALIEGRLDLTPDGGKDQTPWFWSWCKIADDALRNGEPGHWRQGHALILAGPAGCGKNRIQENVITPLLGGREADPTKMLFDGDEFNGDAFAAEHLLLSEVPTPSQRTVDRTLLAERIKRTVAQSLQRMRLMRVEPWTVFPFWRLTISVNDDPDKLRSLPTITPDFEDKVLIFHCLHVPLPMPTTTIAEQRAFRERLKAQMPAFVWWLQNEWEVPEDLKTYQDGRDATRFGFREFHSPVVRGGLYEETPGAELLALIDQARFSTIGEFAEDGERVDLWDVPSWKSGRVWNERALTLQQLLCGQWPGWRSTVEDLAKAFFRHNNAARVLARLAEDEKHRRGRVTRCDERNMRGWLIRPPGNAA